MNEKNFDVNGENTAAKSEMKTGIDTYVHKFQKPVSYDGEMYEKLTFDWGSLTGQDSLAIEEEVLQLGKVYVAPEFSGEYLVRMMSKACLEGVGYDMFSDLPLKEFNAIRKKARAFLMN